MATGAVKVGLIHWARHRLVLDTAFTGKHLMDDEMLIEGMALSAVAVIMKATIDRFAFQLALAQLVFF